MSTSALPAALGEHLVVAERRARAIVEACTHFADPMRVAQASEGLGTAMDSLESRALGDDQMLAQRGW